MMRIRNGSNIGHTDHGVVPISFEELDNWESITIYLLTQ